MKRRILFVDDDPGVLEGLQNLLRRQRRKWDMEFLGSGDDALAAFEQAPFEVIVSDMRMPGMDGATLLEKVRDSYPDTVRVILSGHAEQQAAMRAIPVAHQYLSKPCEPGKLENVVERACSLRELVSDPTLVLTLGQVDTLPPVPEMYSALNRVLAEPDAGVKEVVAVLEQDTAMTAKLLQLVNSSFFTTGMEVTDIEFAVARLGFQTVKDLVLTMEVFANTKSHNSSFDVGTLQQHSIVVAELARMIVTEKKAKENAFTAGLLHDIGKLVLAEYLPDLLENALSASRSEQVPLHVAEQQASGITHAEIGAYLLGLWGLPYPVVEAVANHHAPSRVESPELDELAALHVGDYLAHDVSNGGESSPANLIALDLDYLAPLIQEGQVETWHEAATEFHDQGTHSLR